MTELIESGEFLPHFGISIFCAVCMVLSAIVNLHMLNLAMKYYDQIECIPIYSTFIMIVWITTGLIVFEEAKLYTTMELLKILGSILICCVGIKILTMKSK